LITVSARASTFCGIVKRICFAAFRLIISSNFLGRSTDRSQGLHPLEFYRRNQQRDGNIHTIFCVGHKSAPQHTGLRVGIVENPRFDRRQLQGKVNHHTYKLLVIGDSFFLPKSLLGTLLSRDLGSYDVAVLNAATSGTGPFEYLEEMKTVGTEFKPDVVLLSYYVGNDLTNVQNHPSSNLSGSGITKPASALIAVRADPLRHLYLLSPAKQRDCPTIAL
jgi:hypothetical protein